MLKVKIGGVPEHFNYPWHYGIENHSYQNFSIELEWLDFKGGTGAMVEALNNGSIDMAVLLTEGITADILKGSDNKICQVFVNSPLIWGIHTSINQNIIDLKAIKEPKFAISRFGSGSHIMAYVLAQKLNWTLTKDNFVVVDNIDNAMESLNKNESNLFLWEKFMTMPYVEKKIIVRLDDLPSPWPCFVIAANKKMIMHHENELLFILNQIATDCADIIENPDTFEIISERYQLKKENIFEWFQITQWSTNDVLDTQFLINVVSFLNQSGVSHSNLLPHQLCAHFCKLL